MKILYLAKHDSGGNDDEGAIGWALESLGHEVVRLNEREATAAQYVRADLCLFHHMDRPQVIRRVASRMKTVFWYFDLVNALDDSSLSGRNRTRMRWMEKTVPLVHLGFCTDGDWVKQDKTGKLFILRQGADARIAQVYPKERNVHFKVLLTAMIRGAGSRRVSFLKELESRLGGSLYHAPRGRYREDLGPLVSSCDICIAPDYPVTDLYWSNRVYNTLGFGGFLLHPYCEALEAEYPEGGLVFYRSREEMWDLITRYGRNRPERRRIAELGHKTTVNRHTYTDRCETLLQIVEREL